MPEARHVVGLLLGRGATREKPGEFVLLAAHYDGSGETKGTLTPGADDNASGVAALLECARALAEGSRQTPLPRTVLFAAIDQKTAGNLGPELFADDPPLPLEQCVAAVTVDMIGRSLMDILPGRLFAMGTERSAELEGLVAGMAPPEGGSLSRVESDFHIETSVYTPFRDRDVPYVFVTAGLCQDRDSPRDTPDRLDGPALAARATWLAGLVAGVAGLPNRPTWRAPGEPRIEEVRVVQEILERAWAGVRERGTTPMFERMAESASQRIAAILANGSLTRSERNKLRVAIVGLVRYLFDRAR
jgi:hypothetical protein